MKRWRIEDSKIVIEDEGTIYTPDARLIYRHFFSDLSDEEAAEYSNSLPDLVGELRISRAPAKIALNIRSDGEGNLLAFLGAIACDKFVDLDGSVNHFIDESKTWYPIDSTIFNEARKWLSGLGIVSGNPITIRQYLEVQRQSFLPIEIMLANDCDAIGTARNMGERYLQANTLRADLYPYQKDGIAYLLHIYQQQLGCILADEMGLGKTLQVIGVFAAVHSPKVTRFLVICPSSLLENWRRELSKFTPQLTVCLHTGSTRFGVKRWLEEFDVVVTSYETLVRDEFLFCSINWSIVVLDEAQAIKNPEAIRTICVKRLPRATSIAVSGTPLENKVEDIWSIADFVIPGMLGSLEEFQSEYPNVVQDAMVLGSRIAPIMLRREVSSVADDLPDKIEIPQAVMMTQVEASLYEDLRQSAAGEINKKTGYGEIIKLRMFCAHPSLVYAGTEYELSDSNKLSRLLEILSAVKAGKEKALVFASFQGALDLLKYECERLFKSAFFDVIDGRVQVAERQVIIDCFTEYQGFGVLFLNPRAAGVGLNIVAANHVIHYTPEWNPAVTAQATARAYRRKQKKPVTIHHLYYSDSIEEAIYNVSYAKRDLADAAVQANEADIEPMVLANAISLSPLAMFMEEALSKQVVKKLSKNDLGLTGSHQAGILVPRVDEILNFFPFLTEIKKPTNEIDS
ncbi:hypothetical protein MASR2M48_33980 [Spirochaetota bacterium]